eukprot:5974293-Pleurochrysis_carterae.AAC.1
MLGRGGRVEGSEQLSFLLLEVSYWRMLRWLPVVSNVALGLARVINLPAGAESIAGASPAAGEGAPRAPA